MWRFNQRKAIAAETSLSGNVQIHPKSDRSKALIASAIRDYVLFADLPEPALEVIVGSMSPVEIEPGVDIIKQGDENARQLYVLEDGAAEVWVHKEGHEAADRKATYVAGSLFGELALMYNCPRAATVRAVTRCKLWVMERSTYAAIKHNFTAEQSANCHSLLSSIPLLAPLSAHHKALLVDVMKKVSHRKGDKIVRAGDPVRNLLLVASGTLNLIDPKNKAVVRSLDQPGACFGDTMFLKGEAAKHDLVASVASVSYAISAEDFTRLLGDYNELWRFQALQKVEIFFSLTERQLWQLSHAMTSKSFAKAQVVFRKGEPGDAFYVVEEGSFTAFDEKGKELAMIGPGGCCESALAP